MKMSLPLLALGATLFSTFGFVKGQNGGTVGAVVDNDDPAISYTPSFCPSGDISDCFGSWWNTILDDGSAIRTTGGPASKFSNVQTRMEFTFQGSRIELHGLMDPTGANMIIQLDDEIAIVNTSSGIDSASLQPTALFNKDGLNSDTTHTLSVGWLGQNDASGPSSYIYFDRFVVWNYHSAAVISPGAGDPSQTSLSASATSSPFPVGESSGETSVKPGVFVGVTLASLALLLAFVYGSIRFLRNRRRLRAPSARFRVWITSQMESRIDGPPSPPLSMLKAQPHMSLPPAYKRKSKELEKQREEERQKQRESFSYLDLESGTFEESRIAVPVTEQARSDARHSIKLTIPQQPHFKPTDQISPNTPYTPYTVRVSRRVLPQYSQAKIVDHRPPVEENSGEMHRQRNWPTASEEKRRPTEAQTTEAPSRGASSSVRHVDGLPLPAGLDYLPQLSNTDTQCVETVRTFGDTTNISPRTISAPPPYAL